MSFGFPLQFRDLFADPYAVTTFLASRRRAATAPRRRIVSVSNHWRVAGPHQGREVLVELLPEGRLTVDYLPDEHPALVRFLAREAVAA